MDKRSQQSDAVGQALLGTTWGGKDGLYAEVANGRFSWFKQAKFGIFIHWGLYSLLEGEWRGQEYRGIAEWIMRVLRIPVADYETLARQFNPQRFDADEWLALFQEAGAQYVTITAKHHDGFCLFGSDVSPFNSVRAAALGRDIIAEMSRAAARRGVRLCLYYSQDQDWHEPQGGGNDWDFAPGTRTAEGRRRYVDEKVRPQLEELLTRYGPVGYIWFDTPGYLAREEAASIRQTVTALQPECMSSSRLGYDLGDFESLPDQMVPESLFSHRCETAMTHNDSWAYSKFDSNWKRPEELIRQLVKTVSCGANYLLNVGPRADGTIPAASVAALRRIGAWLKVNGESIYGAQPNPLGAELPWGVCTAKPGMIYVHLFNPPRDGSLLVPYSGAIAGAALLATGAALAFQRRDDRLTITLPETLPDDAVTVIALRLAAEAGERTLLMPNHTNVLKAKDAACDADVALQRISWMHETFGNWHHRDALIFSKAGACAEFAVEAVAAGDYELLAAYDFAPAVPRHARHTLEGRSTLKPVCTEPRRAVLRVGEACHRLTLPFVTPGYFETQVVCQERIRIPAGAHRLVLQAEDDCFPELVELRLVPKQRES